MAFFIDERDTREKKTLAMGKGKTPHLSNVGMAGQAGESRVSPDGCMCEPRVRGNEEFHLYEKLEKKRVLGQNGLACENTQTGSDPR